MACAPDGDAGCQDTYYCAAGGTCEIKLEAGTPCSAPGECASGFCQGPDGGRECVE
jgi:hypothetical protein